ncbi:MAG: ABC transporter substrate-binding protein [Ruminococcus sp.]|nr:ABC transporter substrate-binding protein [Ruminococcus sp.]MDY2743378.1 ABC transporter substrate-binding protein [Eubacteriales bacterium]
MKKLLVFFVLVAMTIALFACADAEAEKETIRIAGLKGPTSIGLVKVMKDNADGKAANKYEFTIAGSADEITPKLNKGELDMAAIPANLASVLYNNTNGAIKVLAINTLGVLYIVEKGDTVKSVADLKGKTIYATGKGSTPEYTLRYILSKNGVDPDNDVTIEWQSEPTAVVPLLKANDNAIAMLPQPYVTVAQSNVEGLNIALNLTDEWGKIEGSGALVTGVLVARTEFVEKHPDAVKKMLNEYAASSEYVNANIDDAAALVEEFDIFKAAIAKKAIPYCNIKVITGDELRTSLSSYLAVLFEQNAKAVGGKLPDDAFYYVK